MGCYFVCDPHNQEFNCCCRGSCCCSRACGSYVNKGRSIHDPSSNAFAGVRCCRALLSHIRPHSLQELKLLLARPALCLSGFNACFCCPEREKCTRSGASAEKRQCFFRALMSVPYRHKAVLNSYTKMHARWWCVHCCQILCINTCQE